MFRTEPGPIDDRGTGEGERLRLDPGPQVKGRTLLLSRRRLRTAAGSRRRLDTPVALRRLEIGVQKNNWANS